jgi:hypothetical protein
MEPRVSKVANEDAVAVERTKPSLVSPPESMFAINLHECNHHEVLISNVLQQ